VGFYDREGESPGPVASVPGTTTLTTTNSLVIAENLQREWLRITNTGDENAYLSVGSPAIIGAGIFLPTGGTFQLDSSFRSTEAVYGISVKKTTTVAFQEASKL